MSSRSSPQTTTTTSAPPAYLQNYLEEGAAGAQRQYYQDGTPVVGFAPQTQQALRLAEQRATQGSPVTAAAQNYTTSTLGGGFMGGNPALGMQSPFLSANVNPHLDAMFDQAARRTRGQLTSEFARAGRNIDAAAPARADMLSDLATNIYGGAYESDAARRFGAHEGMLGRQFGAYEAERGRQQQLVPFAPSLAAADYSDIGQLANVGAQHEDLQREQAAQPGRSLDEYLARLSGYPGGTVTSVTPMERNRLAGAMGGASTGAMFGPWGMLGGAVLGGLYG